MYSKERNYIFWVSHWEITHAKKRHLWHDLRCFWREFGYTDPTAGNVHYNIMNIPSNFQLNPFIETPSSSLVVWCQFISHDSKIISQCDMLSLCITKTIVWAFRLTPSSVKIYYKVFLPMVPGGGTVGLQMDFLFSFSSSSSTPPTLGVGWDCTVLCTVLYCIVLYCTVLYCTVLYCTVLYCIVLYCTVLYCTVLYCTVLYYTVLCCTVLYCTVPYCKKKKKKKKKNHAPPPKKKDMSKVKGG